MTFYETLALAMDERGISAAELSSRSGIYQSYFSRLKNGHIKDVSWEKAVVIISALGMTPDEFYYLQSKGGTGE